MVFLQQMIKVVIYTTFDQGLQKSNTRFHNISLRPMFDGLHHHRGKLKIFGLQDLLAW